MKSVLLLVYLFFINISINAQVGSPAVADPSPGITAYGSKPGAFSLLSNVASLAHYEKNEVAVFSERRFMMEELQFFQASAACRMGGGRLGAVLAYQGFDEYKLVHAALAYAKKLGRVSVAIKFNYLQERAGNNTASSALSGQAALMFSISPKLKVGWQLSNLPSTRGKSGGKLRASYRAGTGYQVSDECLIGIEVQKEENSPVNLHAGFSYSYRGRIFFTGGTQSVNGSYYFGAGWARKKLQLHLSVSQHPYLGISPGLLLNHKF